MDIYKKYAIIDGPSLEKLVNAFKNAYSKDYEAGEMFIVKSGYIATLRNDPEGDAPVAISVKGWRITGISHDDGSGHSINVSGNVQQAGFNDDIKSFYTFIAYYNTDSHKGWIEFRR